VCANSKPGARDAGVEKGFTPEDERPLPYQIAIETSTAPKAAATAAKRRYDAAIAVLLELRQCFPATFARLSARRRQPIKIGIHDDLVVAMPELAAGDIALALGVYTDGVAYLAACIEGAPRLGLDGQPVGAVSAEEAAHAKDSLDKIEARKRRSSAAPAPPPSPKRISLADLRTAAERRRQSSEGRAS
jgi:ProP effector